MAKPICRWGILGAANIARKNWKAIRNAENSTLVAVASRDKAPAERFIQECQADTPHPAVPIVCASYEALLALKDIDAVYIPLPTGVRKEWVIRAAEAGKHVLCEKPCAINGTDLKEMLDACRRNRVQFMDGVMFMHSKRLPLLREVLDDGESVGALRRITSQFSFLADTQFMEQNIRVSGSLEPLGCLGDLGWYNIRFALWTMKEQMPERVSGRCLAAHGDVPMEFSGEMFFADGVSVSFFTSFRTEITQWAHISGVKGQASVPDFVLPFFGCESTFDLNQPRFQVDGCSFHMERHTSTRSACEYSDGAPDAQETNMIRRFADIVLSGKLETNWGEQALKTQQVLDACLDSAKKDGKMITLSPSTTD